MAAALFLCQPALAAATVTPDYGSGWQLTDFTQWNASLNDITKKITGNNSPLADGLDLYLYDFTEKDHNEDIKIFGHPTGRTGLYTADLTFTVDLNNKWTVSATTRSSLRPYTLLSSATLDLEGSTIGFYFADSANNVYGYNKTGSGDVFYLTPKDYNGSYQISVATKDLSPVPLPGAAMLLGSGLLGLIGIRRKS